jgi:gamma-glutamyltranspeptidase/glutathione hydrolase/leukotriene-C4 hydrolase
LHISRDAPLPCPAVAAEGPDVLYRGRYAPGLAADVRAAGGVLTEADLAAAQASLRPALRTRVLGVEVLAAPPPSSGAAVAAALLVLAGYEAPLAGAGGAGVHRLVEATKHAFALRSWLGDPGPDPGAGWVPRLGAVLADMGSQRFADGLRCAAAVGRGGGGLAAGRTARARLAQACFTRP